MVNAAGLGADLHRRAVRVLPVHRHPAPRRADRLRQTRPALVNKIVLPVPTARGKGVLVSPTIYGNVMLGPTSEDLQDRTATATSEAGFDFLLEKGRKLMPRLLDEEVTATYSGLRAAIDHGDYLIEADPRQRYLLVGGIRSTGLTAGMAVAEYVRDKSRSRRTEPGGQGELSRHHRGCPTSARRSPARTRTPRRSAPTRLTARSCASASGSPQGELRDACNSVIPPAGLDGLRRRTRVMNGRCQGFFCGAEVQTMLEEARR